MFFSLKFRSQLARTRPETLVTIENNVIKNIRVFGANVRRENKMIVAIFDERKIGFWLDVVFIIEKIQQMLYENKRDLYGHICVFTPPIDFDAVAFLQKNLSSLDDADAVWCAQSISDPIENFISFKGDKHIKTEFIDEKYIQLDKIKNLSSLHQKFPLRKKIEKILLADKYRSTILLGKEYIHKRDCLEWYASEENGFFTPLVFRFSSTGRPVNCFIDAFSKKTRELFARKNAPFQNELISLSKRLFEERLRGEVSVCAIKTYAEFLRLLFAAYFSSAQNSGLIPVVILENIHKLNAKAERVFLDEWIAASAQKRAVVFGTSTEAEAPEEWRQVFLGVITCAVEKQDSVDVPARNASLWEIAYGYYLFGLFFPPDCFTELFEEEGKNADMLQKSLDLLVASGVLRSVDDPSPAISGFPEKVEEALGDRSVFIRSIVRNRLLDWVNKGRLNPCFDLLTALSSLGGGGSFLLMLECIKADIANNTFESIEKAISEGCFNQIVGAEFAESLFYIYKTLRSLTYGGKEEIHETFKMKTPLKPPNAEYKAQILAIQAIYKIGVNDTSAALEQIKESMLLCQNTKERTGISLVYRLFSLINLSRHEINDAIDYLNYAMEYNEKAKDFNEQALGYYYSSVVHFVFGNISKAERIAKLVVQPAIQNGCFEWACKAEFLCGRCYFEIGAYQEAKELFENIMEKYKITQDSPQSQIVLSWIGRSKLYLREKETNLKNISCFDAVLFSMEENYINKNYETVVELADSALRKNIEEDFIFLEQPCWESGFSQCELLSFSKKQFWNRVILVWRSLALVKLGPSGCEEAVYTMQKIMRDERLNETDPNMPFYFFANYRIIREADLPEVDRNTAISMAFKRLQRRAGRIDDVKVRQSYLTSQYWNNALFITAKEHKLI
jgi:tetratricopeptide (TPR) repeat protein